MKSCTPFNSISIFVSRCVCVGNYYSLRSQHEKAVLYFQRALKLNPNYLSAWTLMGHEYMELKQTSAAIQAYRQAIGMLISLPILLLLLAKFLLCGWVHFVKPKFHYADFATKSATLLRSQITKVCDTNHDADFHDLCHGLS